MSNTSYRLFNDKILLFGDSIIQFSFNPFLMNALGQISTSPEFSLGGALSNAYARKADVVNRGLSGYNSDQAREAFPLILEHEHTANSKVLLTTIFFGTNDAVLGDSPQAVPLDRFEDNIRFLINTALLKDIKVVVIAPGWHDKENWDARLTEEDIKSNRHRSTENNKRYADKLVEITKELNVPLVNLYEEFAKYDAQEGQSYKDLLSDGIHYRGQAYQLLYTGLTKAIKEWYPELQPELLPWKLPPWRELPDQETFRQKLKDAN